VRVTTSKELFVDPTFTLRYTGPDELLVEGKTDKCPNKNTNDSYFKVDWLVNLPKTVDPGCLGHWHHKDSFTKALQDVMLLCEEMNGGQPTKSKKAKGAAVVSRGRSLTLPCHLRLSNGEQGTARAQLLWHLSLCHPLVGLWPAPPLAVSVTVGLMRPVTHQRKRCPG